MKLMHELKTLVKLLNSEVLSVNFLTHFHGELYAVFIHNDVKSQIATNVRTHSQN